jgi:hypothetical protein
MNAPEPIPFTPEGPTPLIRDMPEAGPYPVAALGPLREPAEAIAAATADRGRKRRTQIDR